MPRIKILKDKNQIIDAAVRIIEAEGLSAVSMRRLSKEMGVSSMTLYNYVRNMDDVMREILIRSFNKLYENMLGLMGELRREGKTGIRAYALALALAMYDFASDNQDVCAYLICDGKTAFHDDAELRPFYDPFGSFLLGAEASENGRVLKAACRWYESALMTIIWEYTIGVTELSREELEGLVDIFISRMFPENL